MFARVPTWLSLGAVLALSVVARAADDPLPAPREVTIYPALPPVTGYYRTSRYEVWQNYGVSRNGQWVPRVAYTPDGAYYMSNGQPYYWGTTHPQWWQPSVMGTPYRSAP